MCARMSVEVYATRVRVPAEDRWCQSPGNWSCRWLLAAHYVIWMVGTKLRASVKAADSSHSAMFQLQSKDEAGSAKTIEKYEN